ncbi:MAG: RodZ domain-containing protein [Candidatus Aminicenantales bacterium]|jgi:cytoskeletal protein RodZ
MATLGQELKKERESRNISLDEMASATKIVGRYLAALEEDRLDTMPGGFFIKGIIRTYAKYLGLDENEVLHKYVEAGVLDEPARSRTSEERPVPAFLGKNKIIVWAVVGTGVFLLLIALLFLWRSRLPHKAAPPSKVSTALTQTRKPSPPPAQKNVAPPVQKPAAGPATEVASKPPAQPVSPPASQPASRSVQAEWKGLTMDISFQEETWIQIYADGAFKVGGLFPAGQKVRAGAEKELLISLGNAGGMTFALNGSPGKTLGRSGEVLNNIRINLDNYKDFLQTREPSGPSH